MLPKHPWVAGQAVCGRPEPISPDQLGQILTENCSECFLLRALDALPEVVMVLSLDSTIVYVNRAYERVVGVPVEKVIGCKLAQMEPKASVLNVLSLGVTVYNSHYHIEHLRKDIITSMAPIVSGDKVIGAVAVFRDISEVISLHRELECILDAAKEKIRPDMTAGEKLTVHFQLLEEGGLIRESPAMNQIMESAGKLSRVDTTALITGESGVGKEVIARAIHRHGRRASGPFIKVNCSSIPRDLFEAELFGYERGAFTGASRDGKVGLFQMANGGTLLLDEIGELPLPMQAKLLDAIQDREIRRIGGLKTIPVNVRIIAATNRSLESMIENGTFRQDLFYRLNVVPLHVPPLRDRPEDILPLAQAFLKKFNLQYGANKVLLSNAENMLVRYPWPGNVRELQNLIERLVVLASEDHIGADHEALKGLLWPINEVKGVGLAPEVLNLSKARENLERQVMEQAYRTYGSLRKAAEVLGIDHSTLGRKLKRFGLM